MCCGVCVCVFIQEKHMELISNIFWGSAIQKRNGFVETEEKLYFFSSYYRIDIGPFSKETH